MKPRTKRTQTIDERTALVMVISQLKDVRYQWEQIAGSMQISAVDKTLIAWNLKLALVGLEDVLNGSTQIREGL